MLGMKRDRYRTFSEGVIGALKLPNRLVRSATWDPCILTHRRMTEEVLDIYRELAEGGVGMIISGGLPVTPAGLFTDSRKISVSYRDVRVEGFARMADVVALERMTATQVGEDLLVEAYVSQPDRLLPDVEL